MSKVLVLNKEQVMFLSGLLGKQLAECTMDGRILNTGNQHVVKEGLPAEEKAKCETLLEIVQLYQKAEPHALLNLEAGEVLGIFQNKEDSRNYLESMFDEHSDAKWVNKVMHHRDKNYDVQKVYGITMSSEIFG